MVPVLNAPNGRGIRSEEFASAPLYQKLGLAAVLFLPFQGALTLDLGVPVKISELLLIAAIATAAYISLVRRKPLWRAWSPDRVFAAVIAGSIIVATVIALLTADVSEQIRGVHRSVIFDVLLYCAYGLLLLLAWDVLRLTPPALLRDVLLQSFWLCAAAIVIQIIGRVTYVTAPLEALGFDMVPRGLTILGQTLARSGPFAEGQHLGFYAGAILVLALYNRRYVTTVLALLFVVYSESTTGYVGIALAILAVSLLHPRKVFFIALGAALAIGALLITVSPHLRSIFFLQFQKLGLMPATSGNPTKSLDVRSAKAEIGWRMMWDHPFGAGPGRYAANFMDYAPDYRQLPSYLFTTDSRAIVENGYMQIGAELGVVAFCAFIALLAWTVWRVWRTDMGTLAVLVFTATGFSTQSSWTFMPVWACLALVAAVARDQGGQSRKSPLGSRDESAQRLKTNPVMSRQSSPSDTTTVRDAES
jgi:O-antigen ligase